MKTPALLQATRLPCRLCALLTAVFFISVQPNIFAQTGAYLSVFAGTGVSGYYAGDNNTAITARFSGPRGLVFDGAGNLLVGDNGNYVIRKIDTDGKVSVVTGIPQTMGTNNPFPSGPALSTALWGGSPLGVADNGNIYFFANGFSIGKVSNGIVSYFLPATLAGGNTSLPLHYTLKVRGNLLYLAAQGYINVVDLTTQKQVRSIAVTPGTNIRCMALDANGNIFCVNEAGQMSRVDGTTFTTSVIKYAGSDWELYVLTADMTVDNAGNIYIATDNNYIIKFTAGTYTKGYVSGQPGARYPSVAVDASGNVYLPDRNSAKIMRVQYLDQNTNLTSLGISAGTLSPAFYGSGSSFSVTVPNNVDKINITPVIAAATTSMQVRINSGTYTALASGATSADFNLNVGANYINILLQPQHPTTSRTVTITVTRSGIPPPTPTNFTATPAKTSVKLAWDASPGATRYYIYRGTTASNLTVWANMTSPAYTDNIPVGTTYYYAISALEVTNAESPRTATIEGRANTPPVVSAVSASGGAWLGGTLSAEYTYTDVDGGTNSSTYIWYRSPDPVLNTGRVIISGATSKTYTTTSLDVDKYLSVRVTANDGISGGLGVESARVFISAGTLPVKLVSFKSKIVNSAVQLDWRTATEINSHYFSIERSTDARTWESIGRVNAAGESYMPIDYTYSDKTPLKGQSFYRLKTIDHDGTFETSMTLQVDFSVSSPSISVYPVPSLSTITVSGGKRNGETAYFITDAEGKTVRKGMLSNPVQEIDVRDLKKGIYFLKVDGNAAARFIKQ